ncbi:MAG: HEPN domain-containing protein [Chloroflexia bacterium]|nr:HEPN domain-containing protein [Chloroflexia bacterium]
MTPEERNQYIQFRLESALQTFEAAKVLFDNQFWNSSVNRLYYALFYAVNALLVANGIHTKHTLQ